MDVSERKDERMNISEETNTKECQREIEALFRRLNLQNKLQQKMSLADFLKIHPSMKQSHGISEKDLAHIFLQKLLTLDYRARYISVTKDNPDLRFSQSVLTSHSDDFDNLFSDSVTSESVQSCVHPMDVQMAVFHCSDSFLKQNIVTKLSQCQYALPLLVPDPLKKDILCPLWTFRQITKTWKKAQIKDESNLTMKSMPICKAETPMVSFFRLGSLPLSKSELMNTLINDRHSTFFHKNCPGSTKSRHLIDGVAEIAWYCPAGKTNDSFTDCIAFCNLHGDALSFEKQREILTEKSSVTVVLVPTLEKGKKSTAIIQDLYISPKPLIILIADNECGAVQAKDGKYKIGLKHKSQSNVCRELKGIIQKILSGPHASFQLESMANISEVKVDENDEACQKGKSAAMEIAKMFQGIEIFQIKDRFLPCQGDLWYEWCKANKELYHLKGQGKENKKSFIQEQMMKKRQEQCNVSRSEVMRSFTKSLLCLSSKEKEYFLKWTQILTDALSTADLSLILQCYNEKWKDVSLSRNHDESELEKISKKLQSATFGLEHIFREMGQIYEAHRAVQAESRHTDWAKYPEVAAELMISGHPVELMDGDAGHVPLTWISSLLDEVIKKLGDQRVFVLSVLGIQSSGKSTMLNAMFGLQFAVSAGRCTKGAFMQLVKLSEEFKKDLKFEYILVVDTEGLCALELAGNTTLHHDNELATFIVGLGNLTLINIFGENPAEMQDVLQIVVQAFMRMKEVKLSPSCVFVHQNVTGIAAAEKNMDGKRRLLEKLDKMAQLAAKEELCNVKCFSDIIAFNVHQDVKYFAQLWEGSPPMAPPNPGYSESIQDLRNTILFKAKQSAGIKLSYFKSKIHDLWNALMNEQFVFSFKNTLEIEVYRKLEAQYGKWTWTLRRKMLITENEFQRLIKNQNLEKIEDIDLFKEISQTYKEVQKDMTKYFEDDKDKEILVQWRGRFENKIDAFQQELVRGVSKKLHEVIQQKIACKKLDNKKPEFERRLLQKSKDLAQQLKGQVNNEEKLEKQFSDVWSDWVTELTADITPIQDIKLEDDKATIISDLGFEWCLILKAIETGRYKKMSEAGDYTHYTIHTSEQDTTGETKLQKAFTYAADAGKKIINHFTGPLQYSDQELFRTHIKITEQQCLDAIKQVPVKTNGYSPTYLQLVATMVQEKMKAFESKNKYTFNKVFTVDLLLYVFDSVGNWLSQSHITFMKNNDPRTYLERKKMEYCKIFISFCKESSSAVVFGQMMCGKLQFSIYEAAYRQTAIDVAGQIRCTFSEFKGNRSNLEYHLLKSLAQNEDFTAFITYIRNPKKQVQAFIQENINTRMFEKYKINPHYTFLKNVESLSVCVKQALSQTTEIVKTQVGDIDMWIVKFTSFLVKELTLNVISHETFRDIKDFSFLKEEIEKGLKASKKVTGELFLREMTKFKLSLNKILIDQLCNCCWEKCPFCGAVCVSTIKDHSPDHGELHSVPIHRSQAVNGMLYKNTVEISIEFCTTDVTSEDVFYPHSGSDYSVPFKQYRTAGKPYADWSIAADSSQLIYWKWFVCRFKTELESYYGLKFRGHGEIPSIWKTYTKENAIQSLMI